MSVIQNETTKFCVTQSVRSQKTQNTKRGKAARPWDAPDQKGNQWHSGMKVHTGVDAKTGLTHGLVIRVSNKHDFNQRGRLLQGDEGLNLVSFSQSQLFVRVFHVVT